MRNLSKKKQPLISIIINIYNLEFNYVKRSVESVISQNNDNYECIIIDDGSNQKFIHKHYYQHLLNNENIKYIYHKNIGISESRNKGINISTGKYIYFLDGDDFLIPGSIDFMVENIKKFNPDVIHVNYRDIKNSKNRAKYKYSFFNTKVNICPLKFFEQIQGVKFLVNREFIIKNNIYFPTNKKRHEDVYWVLLIKIFMETYLYTNKDIFVYDTVRTDSFTNIVSNEDDSELFIDMILDVYNRIKNNNNLLNKFYYYVIYYINKFMFTNYKIKLWQHFFDKNNDYFSSKQYLSFRYKILIIIYNNKYIKLICKPLLENSWLRKKLSKVIR